MTFATAAAATECYRAVPHNRPLRPDGKPNRPLTMFSVAFWKTEGGREMSAAQPEWLRGFQ
jgi:hypothetical protein